jgi:hypothetical protein
MPNAVRRTCDMAEALRGKGRPWSDILLEVERARIRQGSFEPPYAGCEQAPYRIRFVPPQSLVKSALNVQRLTHPDLERVLSILSRVRSDVRPIYVASARLWLIPSHLIRAPKPSCVLAG